MTALQLAPALAVCQCLSRPRSYLRNPRSPWACAGARGRCTWGTSTSTRRGTLALAHSSLTSWVHRPCRRVQALPLEGTVSLASSKVVVSRSVNATKRDQCHGNGNGNAWPVTPFCVSHCHCHCAVLGAGSYRKVSIYYITKTRLTCQWAVGSGRGYPGVHVHAALLPLPTCRLLKFARLWQLQFGAYTVGASAIYSSAALLDSL